MRKVSAGALVAISHTAMKGEGSWHMDFPPTQTAWFISLLTAGKSKRRGWENLNKPILALFCTSEVEYLANLHKDLVSIFSTTQTQKKNY